MAGGSRIVINKQGFQQVEKFYIKLVNIFSKWSRCKSSCITNICTSWREFKVIDENNNPCEDTEYLIKIIKHI